MFVCWNLSALLLFYFVGVFFFCVEGSQEYKTIVFNCFYAKDFKPLSTSLCVWFKITHELCSCQSVLSCPCAIYYPLDVKSASGTSRGLGSILCPKDLWLSLPLLVTLLNWRLVVCFSIWWDFFSTSKSLSIIYFSEEIQANLVFYWIICWCFYCLSNCQ